MSGLCSQASEQLVISFFYVQFDPQFTDSIFVINTSLATWYGSQVSKKWRLLTGYLGRGLPIFLYLLKYPSFNQCDWLCTHCPIPGQWYTSPKQKQYFKRSPRIISWIQSLFFIQVVCIEEGTRQTIIIYYAPSYKLLYFGNLEEGLRHPDLLRDAASPTITLMLKAIDSRFFPVNMTPVHTCGFFWSETFHAFYLKIVAGIMLINFSVLYMYCHFPDDYVYLTQWGLLLSQFYFILALVEHYAYIHFFRKCGISSWKFTHFCYSVIAPIELLINGVYWFVFFPNLVNQPNKFQDSLSYYEAFGQHLVPFFLLCVEFIVSNIGFWNLWILPVHILILLGYLALNAVYTINYQGYLTYIMIVCCLIAIILILVGFRLVFWLSKEKKVRQRTQPTPQAQILSDNPGAALGPTSASPHVELEMNRLDFQPVKSNSIPGGSGSNTQDATAT